MAVPALSLRERILANLVTTLAAISPSGGYASTMETVVRGHLAPLEHFGFPCASIIPVDDPEDWTPQTAQHELHCLVRVWIDETQATAASTLEALLADLTEALQGDTTRGGVAEYTIIESTVFIYQVATERLWGAEVLIRISFKTSIVSPRIGV
jgi:hypothetical protein